MIIHVCFLTTKPIIPINICRRRSPLICAPKRRPKRHSLEARRSGVTGTKGFSAGFSRWFSHVFLMICSWFSMILAFFFSNDFLIGEMMNDRIMRKSWERHGNIIGTLWKNTLWLFNIAVENLHFYGKIHYEWPFSIAMLNFQRVYIYIYICRNTCWVTMNRIDMTRHFIGECGDTVGYSWGLRRIGWDFCNKHGIFFGNQGVSETINTGHRTNGSFWRVELHAMILDSWLKMFAATSGHFSADLFVDVNKPFNILFRGGGKFMSHDKVDSTPSQVDGWHDWETNVRVGGNIFVCSWWPLGGSEIPSGNLT